MEPRTVLKTQAEAEARIKELNSEGWRSLPADFPEEARMGFYLFRYVSDETGEPFDLPKGCVSGPTGYHEEAQIIAWEIFGKTLLPNVAVVTAEELVKAIQTETVYPLKCDNPMQRLLGFVWYHVDEGVAYTRRVTLTKFKGASEEDRAVIMNLHTQLSAKPGI
jgi:hypothetical protein